jgi:hypothetical protein
MCRYLPDLRGLAGSNRGTSRSAPRNVGRVEVEAEVTTEILTEILKEVVSPPHGWGHNRPGAQMRVTTGPPGASYNDVADDRLVDDLSGTAAFNGTRVAGELPKASSSEHVAASIA